MRRITIQPDENPREVYLREVTHITLVFPKFNDGRALSQARVLRMRGYCSTIAATGEIAPDVVPMMMQCGIDQIRFPDAEQALRCVDLFPRGAKFKTTIPLR